MTSNIKAIRAAQAQTEKLRKLLRILRKEAMENDGVVDSDEQSEIDHVEGMINEVQRLLGIRLQAWGANKTAFEKLRSGLNSRLSEVTGNKNDALAKDKQVITNTAAQADKAAAEEDFAAALSLSQELKRLIDLFLKRLENERLNGLTTKELTEISLAGDALDEVFTEAYMEELKDMEFAGEGTPELKEVIKKIEKGLSGANRAEVLGELASIVGKPPSAAELDADYARFLILCKQRDAIGDEGGHTTPEAVDEEKHPEFVGSHMQLMFGKVLGDALGIHEVFATLLSPTGGLVGPGNDLIPGILPSPHLSSDNAVAVHGTVHDAAGYLDSFHEEGPGYNYRGNEIEALIGDGLEFVGLEALLPVTGQVSGIYYWASQKGAGEALGDGAEMAEAIYDDATVELEKALAGVRADATAEIDKILAAFEETKQDALDKFDAVKDDLEDRAEQAEQDIRDFAEDVEEEVLEAKEAFEDGVERVSNTVVEKYESLSEGARGLGEDAMEKLNALANFIWN